MVTTTITATCPCTSFCGDELLTAYLRPSKIDASKLASRALLKLLVQRLRQAWPLVKLTIRADSGFCRWRLMRWCDSHGIGYVLGLARNPVLERSAADWTGRADRQFRKTAQPQRIFGSFSYAASSWGLLAAGDRQGASQQRAREQPAVHRGQCVLRVDPQELLRGRLLPAGEHGEPDQGAATGPVRGPDQLPPVPGHTSFRLFALSSAAYVLVQALRRTGASWTRISRRPKSGRSG